MSGAVDWWFRDRTTGRIVVGQAPNPPLWVFLAAMALRWLWGPSGAAGTALDVVAVGSITWWGGDELLRGVNPWRRAVGAAVLAIVAARTLG